MIKRAILALGVVCLSRRGMSCLGQLGLLCYITFSVPPGTLILKEFLTMKWQA